MTIPTQLVLEALLDDPQAERYGLEIGDAAGLRSGTVHPILARLEAYGWLTSRWEDIDASAEGRPAPPVLHADGGGCGGGTARAGPGLPAVDGAAAPPAARSGMSTTRAPLRVARVGVELAVHRLPELDDRLRYRAEFLSELHSLPRSAQLRYTAGVLSQAFALRAALDDIPTRAEEAAMTAPTTTPRIPFFRCRVFRWHRWVTRSTDDGDRYAACAHCGRLLHDGATSGPNSGSFNIGAFGA